MARKTGTELLQWIDDNLREGALEERWRAEEEKTPVSEDARRAGERSAVQAQREASSMALELSEVIRQLQRAVGGLRSATDLKQDVENALAVLRKAHHAAKTKAGR